MATVLSGDSRDREFERLYECYVKDVYRYALAVLRNPADAEDVTQTTFMNAYRAFKRGEEPIKPQHWLIKIAHNACRTKAIRASRRPKEVPFDDAVGDLAVPEDEQPNVKAVLHALGRLPFNQRSALVMRELEGRSYEEIAETLGVSVPAVETLIFRARRSLRLRREALRGLTAVPLPASLQSFFGSGAAATSSAVVGGGLAIKAAAVLMAIIAGGAGFKAVEAGIAGDSSARPQPRPVTLGSAASLAATHRTAAVAHAQQSQAADGRTIGLGGMASRRVMIDAAVLTVDAPADAKSGRAAVLRATPTASGGSNQVGSPRRKEGIRSVVRRTGVTALPKLPQLPKLPKLPSVPAPSLPSVPSVEAPPLPAVPPVPTVQTPTLPAPTLPAPPPLPPVQVPAPPPPPNPPSLP